MESDETNNIQNESMPVPSLDGDGWAATLKCPRCSSQDPDEHGNLHQLRVIVQNRFREDGDCSFHEINKHDHTEIRTDPKIAIGRREALLIEFSCELCCNDITGGLDHLWLVIEQHKGSTYMRWTTYPADILEAMYPRRRLNL